MRITTFLLFAALLEHELSPEDANAAMLRVGKTKAKMVPLSRPASLGSVTVADVVAAEDTTRHIETVQRWAHRAWQAWSEHHETVQRWAIPA